MGITVSKSRAMENSMRPCKEKSMGSIDRISDLPDNVLAHILSFLSITEAVHTCILSKKWKNIWCYVAVLEFDFVEFCRDRSLSYEKFAYEEKIVEKCEVKFASFVQGVLENREARLDKFKLHWHTLWSHFPRESFRKFILQAIKFKPRVFSVRFCKQSMEFDMDPIFNCASLEVLALRQPAASFKAPDSINLPCLKRLNISFQSIDDNFVDKILLGCPILEEIFIYSSSLYLNRISSKGLKKLTIEYCNIDEGCWLEISTPSLLHLEIAYSTGLPSISWTNLASLTNACIDLKLYWSKDIGDKVTANDLNFLSFLSNVTTLDLTRNQFVEEKTKFGTSNHPSFPNLTSLRVGWCMGYFKLDLITYFLRHSPNLQKITIELNKCSTSVTKKGSSMEKAKDVLFRRECLESVKIVNVKTKESKKFANQLVESLSAHVKTIGEIIID